MRQIRARIREKRGVDYTEEEIRELANVKLESFSIRAASGPTCSSSSAAARRRRRRATTRSRTRRSTSRTAAARWIRKLLNPILKLFFNPNR